MWSRGEHVAKRPLPTGYIGPIGTIENPDYTSQLASFRQGLAEVRQYLQSERDAIYQKKVEEWRLAVEEWERTPISEWEQRNKHCPYCHGEGEVYRGFKTISSGHHPLDTGEDWGPCEHCNGTGKCDAITLKGYYKPHKPSKESTTVYSGDVDKELRKRSLKEPVKYFDAYIKIATK